jgi:hypothetical protein
MQSASVGLFFEFYWLMSLHIQPFGYGDFVRVGVRKVASLLRIAASGLALSC